jgi:integrase
MQQVNTWADNHGSRILRRFERDIFPWMGKRPITDITAPELLTILRKIEARGAVETAHRALSNCSQSYFVGFNIFSLFSLCKIFLSTDNLPSIPWLGIRKINWLKFLIAFPFQSD